jgi:hypothetical protein
MALDKTMPNENSNLLAYCKLILLLSNVISLVMGGLLLESGLYCCESCHYGGFRGGGEANLTVNKLS